MSPPRLEVAAPETSGTFVENLPSDRLSICQSSGSVKALVRSDGLAARVTMIWHRSAFPVSADWRMLSDPAAFKVKIW